MTQQKMGTTLTQGRRGNCHDKAVAESFFQLLKRERIRRQIYANRRDARADVFNYMHQRSGRGAQWLALWAIVRPMDWGGAVGRG